MKRDFLSVSRLVISIVFVCVVLAIATKTLGPPSSTPAWAALHDSPASPYRNVIVVAKSGGDFDQVQKALSNIGDNSPTNRYLVWVAPGTYTETVMMKQYVDIEGAGEMATRIVSAGGANSATLVGASNAELRYLTVESTSSPWTTAIRNANASPSLLHVTAITSLATSYGIRNTSGSSPDIWTSYGIRNTSGSSPIMTNVTISNTVASYALNYGVANEDNSSPTMRNVNISVAHGISSIGVDNDNSSSTMKDVTVSASDYAVRNHGSSSANFSVIIDTSTLRGGNGTISNGPNFVTHVGASKLEGGSVYGSSVTCAGVYDENYAFFPNTCP